MSFFPVIELVDRYCIAELKFNKTGHNTEELEFYKSAMCCYATDSIKQELLELYSVHEKIWSLESELKTGRESELSLEEIGRRAIQIRNWNNKRIALKNVMAEKLGCAVREIKKDHLSQ
jgi:hypothetical protein